MDKEVKTKIIRSDSKIGVISVVSYQGEDIFLFLERFDPKVRIPRDKYECRLTWSPRFQTPLPILNVVNRQGIRIHAGNQQSDSEGCLLIGKFTQARGSTITESRKSLARFIQMFWTKNPNNIVTINLGN